MRDLSEQGLNSHTHRLFITLFLILKMFDLKRRRISPMIVFPWSSPLIGSLHYDKKIAC